MTQLDFPEMAVNALLLADSAVTNVVVARIYPVFPPQNQIGPFIVYSLISQLPDRHLASASTLQHVRIQIDCYATTDNDVLSSYGVIKTLANNVRLALDGYRGPVTILVASSQMETQTKRGNSGKPKQITSEKNKNV